ncbi:MAG: GNAT family N-acetyltransferase [Thermoplasmata archaeon]|nr:GNAT family N-acetyltransferase [Thermoplasmata archaeon]
MTGYRVVVAGDAHVPAILGLWAQLIDHHAALDPFYARLRDDATVNFESFVRELIAGEYTRVLVAIEDGAAGGRVVGYNLGRIVEYPPIFEERVCGEILDMHVAPEHRRRGVATMLLERMMEWFRGMGMSRAEVNVHPLNTDGQAFWRGRGFTDRMNRLYRTLE